MSKLLVFVLISQKNGRFFFGQTHDIHKTLYAYNYGNKAFSKQYAPVEVFATKEVKDRHEANELEQELRKRNDIDEILLVLLYKNFVIHDDRNKKQ